MTDRTNDRRDFVKTAALAAAVLAVKDAGLPAIAKGASPVVLSPLPWADNALEPFISKNRIRSEVRWIVPIFTVNGYPFPVPRLNVIR